MKHMCASLHGRGKKGWCLGYYEKSVLYFGYLSACCTKEMIWIAGYFLEMDLGTMETRRGRFIIIILVMDARN